jgi:polysaccharide transporter, PST family
MKLMIKNIFSSGLVQGINLLVPLLLTPFLISNVGLEQYGVMAISMAITGIFMILTDFGFSVTSVRRLVTAKNNPDALSRVLSKIFYTKLYLTGLAFLLYVLLISLVPQFHKHFLLHFYSFLLVLGHTFLPSWYFQAFHIISKMIWPSVIFKVTGILFVLWLIKTPSDAKYVHLILGIGNILLSAVLCFYISKMHKISFSEIRFSSVKEELINSSAIFISNIGTAVYANISIIILGFFISASLLGIYSIAEKIIQLLKGFLSLIHINSYPRICLLVENKQSVKPFIKCFYGLIWTMTLLLSIGLFSYPNLFVLYFIEGAGIENAAETLRKMSFLIFIVSLNMPFFQILLAYHKDWLIVKTVVIVATLSIVLNLVLQPFIQLNGAILSLYVAELLITFTYISFAKGFIYPKNNPN